MFFLYLLNSSDSYTYEIEIQMAFYSDDSDDFYGDDYEGDSYDGEEDYPMKEMPEHNEAIKHDQTNQPKEDSVFCECRTCCDDRSGKYRNVTHGGSGNHQFYLRQVEEQQLEEYTKRNGHLAKTDPLRHACGNGAVTQRRKKILDHRGFCVHIPNTKEPTPYIEIEKMENKPKTVWERGNEVRIRLKEEKKEKELCLKYTGLINDYHFYYEMMDTPSAAFSRHHSFVMASMSSTCSLLEKGLWETKKTGFRIGTTSGNVDMGLLVRKQSLKPWLLDIGYGFYFKNNSSIPISATTMWLSNYYMNQVFTVAKTHVHDELEITRFTPLSHMQRNMVTAQSGIVGLLISRLFMPTSLPYEQYEHTYRDRFKQSRVIARRVHSKKESEIFADNRYGKSDKSDKSDSFRSFELISKDDAFSELRILYASEMDDLMKMIKKYKRGLVNADTIRDDPKFYRMIKLWMSCLKEAMSVTPGENIKHTIDVLSVVAEFPLLYSSDMLSILSARVARLVKVTYSTALRLSYNKPNINSYYVIGCRVGLLAFAAIEPRMIDEYLAPKLAICGFDGNNCSDALDNHVPSRCPIFGKLRKKYEVHMPRTGDCVWEICRKRNGGSEIRSI